MVSQIFRGSLVFLKSFPKFTLQTVGVRKRNSMACFDIYFYLIPCVCAFLVRTNLVYDMSLPLKCTEKMYHNSTNCFTYTLTNWSQQYVIGTSFDLLSAHCIQETPRFWRNHSFDDLSNSERVPTAKEHLRA